MPKETPTTLDKFKEQGIEEHRAYFKALKMLEDTEELGTPAFITLNREDIQRAKLLQKDPVLRANVKKSRDAEAPTMRETALGESLDRVSIELNHLVEAARYNPKLRTDLELLLRKQLDRVKKEKS